MLWTLIKIRLKSVFAVMMGTGSRNRKKKKKTSFAEYVIMAVFLFAVLMFAFGTMVYQMCRLSVYAGMDWLYFSVAGIFAFLLSFVGSVFLTQSQLYESNDNEMLLAMPVKPGNILLSRMVALLLVNGLMTAVIMIPAAVSYVLVRNETGAGFPYGGVLWSLAAMIVMPFGAVAVSALFGWIIQNISARTGRKNIVTLIMNIILFGVYMYFCFSWQSNINALIANGHEAGEVIRKMLPPFYAFGKAAADGSALYGITFILWCVIAFAVCYLILKWNFIRLITMRKSVKKAVYKEEKAQYRGAESALFRKDMKMLTSSNMYMFNAGIGTVFMLVAAVAAVIKKDDLSAVVAFTGDMTAGALAGAVLTFMSSMCIISAPSVSLEARTLWMLRSMPVDMKKVILSKVKVHIAVVLPVVAVSAAVMTYAIEPGAAGTVIMFAMPVAFSVMMAFLGISANLRYPKFDWTNEAYAVKQGMAPFIASIGGMVLAVGPSVFSGYLFLKHDVPIEICAATVTVLYLICAAVFFRYAVTSGAARIRNYEV